MKKKKKDKFRPVDVDNSRELALVTLAIAEGLTEEKKVEVVACVLGVYLRACQMEEAKIPFFVAAAIGPLMDSLLSEVDIPGVKVERED